MDDQVLLFMLTSEIESAYHQWDAEQPARTGLHASSVLESDKDFCVRQHVIAEHYPDERQAKEQYLPSLQKFVHGWAIHKKLQEEIFKRTGRVIRHLTGDHELDLTHLDYETQIMFSPDVIIKYGDLTIPIEIKGINTEDFQGCVGKPLQEAAARNKSIRSAIPQLNLYLHLLGLTEPPNNRGIIFAEDKNTQKFEMWVHTYDAQLAEQPIDRAMHVKFMNRVHKRDLSLPAKICSSIMDSRAKRCPFRSACFTRE